MYHTTILYYMYWVSTYFLHISRKEQLSKARLHMCIRAFHPATGCLPYLLPLCRAPLLARQLKVPLLYLKRWAMSAYPVGFRLSLLFPSIPILYGHFSTNTSMVASSVQDLRFSSMFETLSLDVRLCVLEFLQPCDILAVGQTCRTLCQMMKYRAVWMNALRGVMERHSINPATFPVRTMALPLLKHLAFSPHRFISLVKKSNGASIRPMSIRVISPRLSNADKKKYRITDKDGINDIYMEPGGRYLASLSCYQNSTLITIWDLGFSGGDAIKPIVRQLVSMSDLTLDGFYSDRQRLGKFYLILSQNSPPSTSHPGQWSFYSP
ncbi:hypothetical protein CPB84DRAFT_331070 [Gymnopilus junonius]|uniref:F-box domain-containing protein n=1 Tax=Gymnopilus junonius TaxID=109634 RepID=A0A9P5TGK4_GYMJU|nr:hypothetical protein CPB84DRAFT_331070 [Gymnopilus junonius]